VALSEVPVAAAALRIAFLILSSEKASGFPLRLVMV